MHNKKNFWFLLGALMMMSGCADSPSATTTAIVATPLSQQWTLDSVGSWRVPVSIGIGSNASRQIQSGRLFVDADSTWTFRFDHHDTGADVDLRATSSITGRYTVEAGDPMVLTLSERGSSAMYTGIVGDDSGLDVVIAGHRYHFVPAR